MSCKTASDPLSAISGLEQGTTKVSGTLAGNTTWTSDNIYLVADDIVVPADVVLTIKPGTVVRFAGFYQIQVFGQLLARGTASAMINFLPAQADPKPDSWYRLYFEPADTAKQSIISYCRIAYARWGIYCHTASPEISNNVIERCEEEGVNARYGSKPLIEDNSIQRNPIGVTCFSDSDARILSNSIANNGTGIEVNRSAPVISGNSISQNGTGVRCSALSNPHIEYNTIERNHDGISLYELGRPRLRKNLIAENTLTGVRIESLSKAAVAEQFISDNNLLNVAGYDIFVSRHFNIGEFELAAANNWWGTTDTVQILNRIFDRRDDSDAKGTVLYQPFASAPIPDAGANP